VYLLYPPFSHLTIPPTTINRVHQGVLFVFPDASPEGWEASQQVPIPHVDLLDDEDYHKTDRVSGFVRDVPYGYDTLMENLMVSCN